METVLRTFAIYLIILVWLRLTGKRVLAQVTTLDLILLLVMSEATQQALLGDDNSVTTAAIVITSLVFFDRTVDYLQYRFRRVSKLVEGIPVVLVEHGIPMWDRLRKEQITVKDLLTAARSKQGLLRLDQIEFAILESSGGISIVPRSNGSTQAAGEDEVDRPWAES